MCIRIIFQSILILFCTFISSLGLDNIINISIREPNIQGRNNQSTNYNEVSNSKHKNDIINIKNNKKKNQKQNINKHDHSIDNELLWLDKFLKYISTHFCTKSFQQFTRLLYENNYDSDAIIEQITINAVENSNLNDLFIYMNIDKKQRQHLFQMMRKFIMLKPKNDKNKNNTINKKIQNNNRIQQMKNVQYFKPGDCMIFQYEYYPKPTKPENFFPVVLPDIEISNYVPQNQKFIFSIKITPSVQLWNCAAHNTTVLCTGCGYSYVS